MPGCNECPLGVAAHYRLKAIRDSELAFKRFLLKGFGWRVELHPRYGPTSPLISEWNSSPGYERFCSRTFAPCLPNAVRVDLSRCAIVRLCLADVAAFLILRPAAARCLAVAIVTLLPV